MDKKTKKILILIIGVLLIATIDQLTKYFALKNNGNEILNGQIQIEYVKNEKEFDDIFLTIFYEIISIVIIIKFFIKQIEKINKTKIFAIIITLGGGISNVLDKILFKESISFIKLTKINLPKFNLAYILLIIGWIMIVWILSRDMTKNLKDINNKVR